MALPSVILLHGCGGSPQQAFADTGWITRFEAEGRDVLAPFLPGHGRAGQSHDPADYADLAGDLLARLPDGPFDIVGFSLGGKLALDIAVRAPGRVRRIVLGGVGDNVFAPEAIGEAAASALEHGPQADTPPPVRMFLDTWDPTLNDPLAVAAVLRRPPNPVFAEDAFMRIESPILIVNGGDDVVAHMGTRLLSALGVQQILLPGVGHFDLTAQKEFCTSALEFLGA